MLREAADGGGKEKETGVRSKKKRLVQVHTVLTHILNSLVAVLLLHLRNSLLFRPSLAYFPPPPPFPSLVRLLAFSSVATYEGCSNQTQPVSSGVPREHYPTFLLLCFLSFSLPPIYLQLDVCSPIDCFTEDMSGLCLCPAPL